jgi:hypothetical protein
MIAPLWWCWDGASLRTGPWVHPVRINAASSVRIGAASGRVQANADLPRVLLDGDTDIDNPADNERIEVEG